MGFRTRYLLIAIAAFASSCSDTAPEPTNPTSINQVQGDDEPEIVVQVGHQTPVMAVHWVNQGRNLVSLSRDGAIVIWDVEQRVILAHAQAPGDGALQFYRIEDQDSRGKISLIYTAEEYGEDAHAAREEECPEKAKQAKSWCTFTLDIEQHRVIPDSSITVPAQSFWDMDQPLLISDAFFPLSPDGQLRPEAFYQYLVSGANSAPFDPEFSTEFCADQVPCIYGVRLYRSDRQIEPVKLIGNSRKSVRSVDLSADGAQLVTLESVDFDTKAFLQTIDMGRFEHDSETLAGSAYDIVQWVGGGRYTAISRGFDVAKMAQRTTPWSLTPLEDKTPQRPDGLAAARIDDPDCLTAGTCQTVPGYYAMEPLNNSGDFIGAGNVGACRIGPGEADCPVDPEAGAEETDRSYEPMADGISLYRADLGTWQRMKQPDWGDERITAIRISPKKDRLAVLTREGSFWDVERRNILRLRVFALSKNALVTVSKPVLEEQINDYGTIYDSRMALPADRLHWTADGERVVFSHYMHKDIQESTTAFDVFVVTADGSKPRLRHTGYSNDILPIGHDRLLDLSSGVITGVETGKSIASVSSIPELIGAGTIEPSSLIWGAGNDGTIRFWDQNDGTLQLTFYLLPEGRFFALTPGGRYDTNLGPDTDAIRWLVPDAPWQSLAPQTFMRDFFEPGLYKRLLDCRAAANCETAFRKLPAIDSLNRVLPEVRIASIVAGRDQSEAVITVEVANGQDDNAPNGKTVSGIFNPRLFRNGRLVAMTQVRAEADDQDLEGWRRANSVGDTRRFTYTVPMPTSAGSETQTFSAYAFNEDRIKSETVSRVYTRPPVTPRQPRAFVITIGIDDYDTQRFRLNYAAADARALSDRLGTIPEYRMHRLTLTGEKLAGGRRRQIDKATIDNVLALLGGEGNRTAILQELQRGGIDASILDAATPDDLVIVSFAGHGWADKEGNFFLLPSDAVWTVSSGTPEFDTLVSSGDLVRAFSRINAADIALIIDACHSSASVDNGRFKAGPMGDSGLGQLAYDKGILILAATQANDVARENARLGQGLLTYALTGEGLTSAGGRADLNGDRLIYLHEWLGYAVKRLPSLSTEVLGRGGARAASGDIGFSDDANETVPVSVQQPSLFDFTGQSSPVLLRRVS